MRGTKRAWPKRMNIGHKRWAVAEGYIPGWSNGPEPQMTSHETLCILNTNHETAVITLTVFFSDREPAGPYRIVVPPLRTRHIRLNELAEPEPIPKDTDFASVIESNIPIVVQHTRLDSRQAENALISTIAYPAGD
jgi:hypothetical protein